MSPIHLLDTGGGAPGDAGALRDILRAAGLGGGRGKIRCPRCAWRPLRSSRWQCDCGHVWNTFETRGVCPACTYAWPWTACLRCSARSPHEAWYEKDGSCRS